MRYKDLTETGPHYDADYWSDLRALYEGGRRLLCDDSVMSRVFPKHAFEEEQTYTERKGRAVYLNYAGSLVDYLTSSLVAEPLTIEAKPELDQFYSEFVEDVDSRGTSLQEHLSQQFLTALQCKTAWTLIDLPPRDDGAVVESVQDEEDIGALRAMAIPVEPESVLDYECDPGGDLIWALVCLRSQPRESLDSARNTVKESFTYYTRSEWVRYEISYPVDKPPKPEAEVSEAARGSHTFGQVPLVRLCLPHGLWAMDKLWSPVREHLNKRSALSWAQYRSCWPLMVGKLAPEIGKGGEIPAEIAQNPNRMDEQIVGVGRMFKVGSGDSVEYISPDPKIFDSGLTDLEHIRDEIHRVMHQMALAANTNKAIVRSGKSKEMDRNAATIVLMKLGEIGRKFVRDVYECVRAGRKDTEYQFAVHGMQLFDTAAISDVIEDSSVIDTLRIPSQTFQQVRIFNAAKRILAGIATPEQLTKIEDELEKNVTAEEFAGNAPPTSATEWAAGLAQQDPNAAAPPGPNENP